jgi:hypothetical protein
MPDAFVVRAPGTVSPECVFGNPSDSHDMTFGLAR